jgi:ketosteroid isomerase-like protein
MDHSSSEDTLLAQIREDLDRWSEGDPLGYGKSAAEDITYFHNVPALPRIDGGPAFLGFLSTLKGVIPRHTYEMVEPKLQLYGNVGIFTLQYHAFSLEGEPVAQGRGTCVYREAGGGWQMVHTHWSGLDDA